MSSNTLICPNCGNEFPSPVQISGNIRIEGNIRTRGKCPRCSTEFDAPLG